MANPMNIFQAISQVKSNPAMLGFNLPQGMNNPNDIIQHLLDTKQITQSQYNTAVQRAQQLGLRK
jgi:hypothetical protein